MVGEHSPETAEVGFVLEEAGYRVRTARDSAAALAELERSPVGVLIAEWSLPTLGGLGLCRAIRARPEIAALPVIVLGDLSREPERAAQAVDAGVDDYLTRPLAPAELLGCVRRGVREACLRANEAQLQAMMANVPGAIYRCANDAGWTMEVISDEIERISGYPAADFIQNARRTFTSIIHPEDAERAHREVDEANERGRSFALEYRIARADGGAAWVLERGQLVHTRDGRTWLDGIVFDITERRRAEEALRQREAERARVIELRAARARIIEAADAARRRIERDLHDGAQQRLVNLALRLRLVRTEIEKDSPAAARQLDGLQEDLGCALQELRELARGIHPAVLTDRGLAPALEALATRAILPVEILDAPRERLPAPVEAAIYFSVAEALTNVAKYANATHATVRVGRQGDQVALEVTDDGVGGADLGKGSGLSGLADRVAALDGKLELSSEPGSGTVVRAEIPLDVAAPVR